MPPPMEDFDDNQLPADQQSQESEISNVHQQMSPEEIRKANMEAVKVNDASSGFSHSVSLSCAVLVLVSSLSLF